MARVWYNIELIRIVSLNIFDIWVTPSTMHLRWPWANLSTYAALRPCHSSWGHSNQFRIRCTASYWFCDGLARFCMILYGLVVGWWLIRPAWCSPLVKGSQICPHTYHELLSKVHATSGFWMVGCETQDQLMRAGRDMVLVQASNGG